MVVRAEPRTEADPDQDPGVATPGRWRRLAGWPGATAIAVLVAVGLGLVVSGALDHVSIVAARLIDVFVGVTAAALVVGVAGRRSRWWATWGVGILVVAALIVTGAYWWLRDSQTVTDHYPPTFLLWVWLGLVALGVAVTGWWRGTPTVRAVRLVAAPLALLTAFLLINEHYGYWPTVSVLLGQPVTGQVSAGTIASEIASRNAAAAGVRGAVAPTPGVGQYGPVTIPSTPVPFEAETSYVWLPPAYFAHPHEQLPVLLMLPGWPGNVQDWVKAGQVLQTADAWAAAHGGRAPIMILVDENGLHGQDTECVNGPRGQAASYLTEDVPAWAHRALGVTTDWRSWGVVGFSEGGTCAVGLAAEYPDLFGHFIDIAGDGAPNHGNTVKTLAYLYGGNRKAALFFDFKHQLATHRYDHEEGWFTAGTGDPHGRHVAGVLSALAARAGIDVHTYLAPGGHSWTFARDAFAEFYQPLVTDIDQTATLAPDSSCRSNRRSAAGHCLASARTHAASRH